jgi:hypothetical protein
MASVAGLSAAALAPFLPLTERAAEAEDSGFPRRLILFSMPTGAWMERWRPSGGETDFVLPMALQPLEAFREHLLILDGIDNAAAYGGEHGGAHPAAMNLFTGSRAGPGDMSAGGGVSGFGWPKGPSIDQLVADAFEGQTALRSLEVGVGTHNTTHPWQRAISFRGADQPVQPHSSPYEAFDSVFADADLSAEQLERLRADRLSVLSTVQGQLRAVEQDVGPADRIKIQAHRDNLASIEAGFAAGLGVCDPPILEEGVGITYPNADKLLRMQIEIVVASLACDRTRVAAIQAGAETSGMGTHTWLGHGSSSHVLSHESSAASKQSMAEIHRFYAENVAYLLQLLDSVPEGSGTLLDHTVVCWAGTISDSWTHTNRNVPVVLAGRCHDAFATGRYLRWGSYEAGSGSRDAHGGETMNNLLVTLGQAMGLAIDAIGDADLCTGPLIDLLT